MKRTRLAIGMEPAWVSGDGLAKVYCGDVMECLKMLPSKSVHCCVTSPPYFGLRDYGTAMWNGGDPNCDHVEITAEQKHKNSTLGSAKKGHPVTNAAYKSLVRQYASVCKKCGARRVDQQIGAEKTPEEFVAKIVDVCREVYRVLRDDGTFWLNLGDTYSGGSGGNATESVKQMSNKGSMIKPRSGLKSLKSGNLVGIPWRVAFALQNDGWILRQDVIWSKSAPMPESVKNRCTKSHEYIFMLAKKMGYYFDHIAIREKGTTTWNSAKTFGKVRKKAAFMTAHQLKLQATQFSHDCYHPDLDQSSRNKRDVWLVSSEGYEDAHFAVFPQKLIRPCILSGASAKGCCSAMIKKLRIKDVLTTDQKKRLAMFLAEKHIRY